MSGDNLVTWKSMTHDRASKIAQAIGWLLVCVAVGGAFALIAYDVVLQ
jgi:hypothetical protein